MVPEGLLIHRPTQQGYVARGLYISDLQPRKRLTDVAGQPPIRRCILQVELTECGASCPCDRVLSI
ncbi:uncharacterized protein STEHIDRAFT_146874 [Stereum hirsutum FP-91666 SS1]|uniref:uncharacterized protein n=1 Tax=Stereum hirsutum (strain FP-91666) TaxID=721885 RepID=UPI000440DC0B|nr:uncharacterized protein STEHIDRAFT_146874 [Stereum hirsutum FP-91666 SS1]EIM87522.1 hypothetical protein STEHIDRAFT_146874 [Stereum hirsutum FP-91666 SS1]